MAATVSEHFVLQTQPSTSAAMMGATLEPLDDQREASIGLWEVVRLSFDSLLSNKMRSLLTMLGVIIGVASVVALIALGNGASAAITGQFEGLGTNVLTVNPGAPSNEGPGGGESGSAQTLTLDDANAIAAFQLPVTGVAPQFGASAQIVAPAADASGSVVGTNADYQSVNNVTTSAGSFLTEEHVNGVELVIVLGSGLATDLFGGGQAVGQSVRIEGQTLRVIGVLEEQGGGGFGSVDDQAFVPITTAQRRLFGGRTPDGNNWLVSSIALAATNPEDVDAIQARVTALLRERHGLDASGIEDDFNVFNQASILSTLSTVTTLLTVFLASVAGISLVVGGIGIMNIMLVTVTERTREIGLRKAVGARGQDILSQFVVEALVLSVVGGLIGLAIGAGIAFLVSLTGLLSATVTLSSVALAIGFSMAVGLFFGIYPARQAARLNPIDALRYE